MAHHDNRIEGLGTSVLGCGNWYYAANLAVMQVSRSMLTRTVEMLK